MKIALLTHRLIMKQDNRQYDSVHGGYVQLIENLGHAPYLAPDISDKKIISGFLDFVDGVILTGFEYLPKFSQDSMEKNPFDFQKNRRMKSWVDLAMEKEKPLLALGDGFYFLNETLHGKNKIEEGMSPGRIKIAEEHQKQLGFEEIKGILTPSKIIKLGENLEKINAGNTILAYQGEGILGFALYPEFQFSNEEKILDYFIEKFREML